MLKQSPLLLLLLLGACASNRFERLEAQDDTSCRKIVAERNDTSPQAYTQCRANIQLYRQQAATAASGSVVFERSGPPHHWSLD